MFSCLSPDDPGISVKEFDVNSLTQTATYTFDFDAATDLFDDYVKNKWGKQKPLKKGLYNSTLKLSKNVLNEGIFSISRLDNGTPTSSTSRPITFIAVL